MFDVFAKLLSSITSFLFPLFASYKALKTSDPAQLTPWLMYWVVLACALLVESWTDWILRWIPLYAYIRLLFLLYLVLPQTQGARLIYQEHIHPFLEENETAIEDFIADAHDRLRSAGIAYLKRAIELLKTNVLGLPPTEEPPAPDVSESGTPQSYTQSLLARFSLPSARWTGSASTAGTDFYNLLASAVSAATSAAQTAPAGSSGMGAGAAKDINLSASGTLIPENIRGANAKISFIAAQRERLNIVLSALDREATQLQNEEAKRREERASSMSLDGGGGVGDRPSSSSHSGTPDETQRPPSGLSGFSGLSKSRSEADFEKLDAESGAEDMDDGASVRRRTPAATAGGGWMAWGWGAGGSSDTGKSSGVEK